MTNDTTRQGNTWYYESIGQRLGSISVEQMCAVAAGACHHAEHLSHGRESVYQLRGDDQMLGDGKPIEMRDDVNPSK